MFQREIKVNFKNFLIWLMVLIGLFSLVFLIYPSIIHNDNIQMLNEMMSIFPEELLKAFNMDISSMDSVFGWLKTEGFVFVLLIIGCYSGILGSSILVKEESDKTIEYLHSLPVKRTQIVWNKVFAGVFYIVLMVVFLGIFNFIALSLSGEFDHKQYFLLSITPIFPSILIYCICLFLSTFTHKTKKTIGISLGIVLVSYVLQMVSNMAETTEFLKYFSVFTLADVRHVITELAIRPMMVVFSLGGSLVLVILTLIHYEHKELI